MAQEDVADELKILKDLFTRQTKIVKDLKDSPWNKGACDNAICYEILENTLANLKTFEKRCTEMLKNAGQSRKEVRRASIHTLKLTLLIGFSAVV